MAKPVIEDAKLVPALQRKADCRHGVSAAKRAIGGRPALALIVGEREVVTDQPAVGRFQNQPGDDRQARS